MAFTKGRILPFSRLTTIVSRPVHAQKKKKSTLPTQALSCSGSKGLSQPAPVNNPSFASGRNRASTPGAATISKCIFNVVNGKVEKNKTNFSLH